MHVEIKGCVIPNRLFRTSALQAIDRNKDGFITKGELKLAKKSVGMKDIDKVIRENDLDGDGKLNMDEYEKSGGGKRKSKEKKKQKWR